MCVCGLLSLRTTTYITAGSLVNSLVLQVVGVISVSSVCLRHSTWLNCGLTADPGICVECHVSFQEVINALPGRTVRTWFQSLAVGAVVRQTHGGRAVDGAHLAHDLTQL